MKILTILYILLQINTFNHGNYSSANSNNHYSGGNVPVEQTYRGIGYSTNYANGQFNSGVYKSSMATLEYQNRTFTGTYNPSETESSSGGSRPGGQPRKVKGYTADGEETGSASSGPETGTGIGRGESFWEDGYEYYYNKKENRWYRKDAAGNVSEWDNILGWHWTLFYGHTIPDGSTQGYQYPPTPIGDAIIPFLILLHLYIGYDVFKKKS